jgi:hypothetical protein
VLLTLLLTIIGTEFEFLHGILGTQSVRSQETAELSQKLDAVQAQVAALTTILADGADGKGANGGGGGGGGGEVEVKKEQAETQSPDEVKAAVDALQDRLKREQRKVQELGQRLVAMSAGNTSLEVPLNVDVMKGGRILWMISSTDRGDRIRHQYRGDKFAIILRQMREARFLCEYGHTVQVSFQTAWPLEELSDQIDAQLYCERINARIPVWYQEWPKSVGGELSSKHRTVVREHLEEFDMFVHMEDDIHIRLEQVQAFWRQDFLLTHAGYSDKFVSGLMRYEVNQSDSGIYERVIFEPNSHMEAVSVVDLNPLGRYMVFHGGNPHTACWLGTQRLVKYLQDTCTIEEFLYPKRDKYIEKEESDGKGGKVTVRKPDPASWVEFWSGGFQVYFYCKLWKVIPLDNYEQFLVHHVANNKIPLDSTQSMDVQDFVETIMKKPVQTNPERFRNTI